MKGYKAFLIVLVIIILDQVLKFWVKTHMMICWECPEGEKRLLGNWLWLHFTENPGMAFGMVLPGVWGKLFLSAFRLVAVGGGTYFIFYLIKQKAHWGFITCACLILAGAIGNMIDGSVYGILFSQSQGEIATFLPEHGYAGFMQGLVVDMIHVKLFKFHWDGREYEFFPFIFNIADSAITIGVLLILIFQQVFFKEEPKSEPVTEPVAEDIIESV